MHVTAAGQRAVDVRKLLIIQVMEYVMIGRGGSQLELIDY